MKTVSVSVGEVSLLSVKRIDAFPALLKVAAMLFLIMRNWETF